MSPTESVKDTHALMIALSGTLSLAVAMGIGRFAFTPLMPMMLHDGLLDLASASWLASANYLGYLLGALLCTLQPTLWARRGWSPLPVAPVVRGSLLITCGLTALMAVHVPAAWPSLRFIAGIVTAVAFVYTSTWCLGRLSRMNSPTAGGIVYAGPGVGIASSGLLASLMVQSDWHSSSGWIAFALLAMLMTAVVWPVYKNDEGLPPPAVGQALSASSGSLAEKAALTVAYGLAGFGYIITATFLPVIARTALPASVWPDLFWPMLGIAVAFGAIMASRIPARVDQRYLLLACYLIQAAGVALSNWWPTLVGFALGSILVGLPFTAITFFAMQVGRKLHPQSASAIIGLLSASFGLGQIAGPPFAALLVSKADTHATGFSWSLDIAATTLVAGALIFWWMTKRFPPSASINPGAPGH
jgi:MFS family permease